MSVPYTDIFNKFNLLIDDPVLFADLNDEEYTSLLELFLNKSKSVHFKYIQDVLSNYQVSDFYTKTFEYEYSDEFQIERYPGEPNSETIDLVCKVNDVDINEYEFDEVNLKFKINIDLDEEDEVVCGYNFYGQFNDDIADEVQWILATGMKLTWLERKLYAEQNLRNHWSNKDYSIHSPANLLEKLTKLKKDTQKDLDRMIISYTFNDFDGFN